jgi:two-component system phosphate regulon sensor histidine kinase PhoR
VPTQPAETLTVIRPISYIRVAVFTALSIFVTVAVGVGVFFGREAGLLTFSLAMLVAGAYHINNLFKLVRWMRTPSEESAPLPRALGMWDYVFADVNRRSQRAFHKQERLSAALERFREASQAMPHGLMFLSSANTIDWVNHQGEQQFGLDRVRDQGTPVTNIVRQPDFVRYLKSGDYSAPLTFTIGRPVLRTLVVTIVPFSEDMRLLLSEDITQGQRVEAMRRDFVANVSHEMRTPLTVVSGFLAKEDIRHYLGLASEQAGRMQQLIQDLLTLSALETGAPMWQEEPVDVAKLVRDVEREAIVVSGGRHRIELDCSVSAPLLGNAKELHSAFANLAINAVRYTPEGGHIRISWRQRGAVVEYTVEDDGIGIAADHIPRLTERFYRVDRGRSRETGGTGLGLAIVKHVLSRHQGDLLIDSEPGRGSRFTACFPARRLVS